MTRPGDVPANSRFAPGHRHSPDLGPHNLYNPHQTAYQPVCRPVAAGNAPQEPI